MISELEPTTLVLTLSAISLTILFYISRKKTSLLPPGPRGLPVLGYLPFLGINLHHEFTKIAQRFGPIFKLQLGSKTCIIISSSDLAKVVVHEQDNIFANREAPVVALLLTYGGKNITFSDNNSYWRNTRKVLVQEVMSNKNLEASLSFRQSGVRKTIKHVYEAMGTEVDLGRVAFSTSLSIITSMIWGNSLDEDEQKRNLGDGFREVISEIMDIIGTANVSDFFPVLARFDLQGLQRKMKRQFQKLDEILQRIIDDRINVKSQESAEQHGKKDFLGILLELKELNTASSFSIPQIKALLVEIFIGGTDTTTVMVEWTMAELLKNPEIMKKIQEELEQIVGHKTIVEESHIPKLRYLDAAVKETFRLHPPVPLYIVRSPSKSCKVGEYTVPQGSTVYLNVWAIHRDSRYWKNPLDFNPNRFLDTDETTKINYSGLNTNFLPFGSGRRRCPGIPVGEKMLMNLLASLLHSFDWSLANVKEYEMSDKYGVVLKKRNPLIVIPSQRLAEKNLYM